MSRIPTRAETEVRGPDEFPDLDWAPGGHPFYDRPPLRRTEPSIQVIAAGLCPACGETGHLPLTHPAWKRAYDAGLKGYPCQWPEEYRQ